MPDALLVCRDLRTGAKVWATRYAPDNKTVNSSASQELIGTTYWFFGDVEVDSFDTLTGKQVAHYVLPARLQNSNALTTPTLAVAQVGHTLQMFKSGQWTTPVWSVPADNVSVLFMTTKLLVVDAPAGVQVLDTGTGKPLRVKAQSDDNESEHDVVAGLMLVNGAVVDVGADL